ncbi:SAC3 domain-containing protein 1 [Uranotaenia lowii]|uniref:SAC3 domain-containing protein 1 n=1 Tax=Uranotaenia lowii TaxID=190385 RepID=UPI00247AA1EE|nr:SAC3 domain-containing protein 1 [Uranotaenia lowii]
MESFIRGSCETMCPKSEIDLRTKEKMLHFYELKPGSRTEPDLNRVVKEFARSAAGVRRPKHWEIRTFPALKRSVEYLLTEIILDTRRSYTFQYEFIFDRLRAVRQELVMQNLSTKESLELLVPSVRFLSYSAYRLCAAPMNEFDPKICSTHLQECLKKVLRCYEDLDQESVEYDRNQRIQMEGIYLIFNLGSMEALSRGINLSKDLREHLKIHLTLNLEYIRANFYKVLEGFQSLPPLETALASLKLSEIRRQMLLRFSVAFQSKQLTVPLDWIGHILHYRDDELNLILTDCEYYNLQLVEADNRQSTVVDNQRRAEPKDDWWEDGFAALSLREQPDLAGKSVKFEKARMDPTKAAVQSRRVRFVDRKLDESGSLPKLLLHC